MGGTDPATDRDDVDAKVAAVVANWAARFVANELDSMDVQRAIARVRTWDDWPRVWEDMAEAYAAHGDRAADEGHTRTAAAHWRRAALTLQFAQFALTEDVVGRERLHRRQCALYRRAAPLLVPPAQPYELTAGAARVHGYVRRPTGTAPAPAVVLVPGLESTKEQFTTYEPHFLERGIASVSLEGPGQGEGWYAHRFDLATWLRAFAEVLRWLPSQPGIDAARIAVVGTSFGGFLALRAVADHPQVTAVVDIAGPHTLTPLRDLQDVLQQGFVHLTGAADVADADARLADVTLDGVLGRLAGRPTLVVHGTADRVIPVAHGERIVAEHPGPVTFDRVEGGSHSCNNLHTLVRPRVADWVADRLTGRA
ncbi:MAG TPA: alpha/beta fold hydrolase [Egicoccus sp.]|nr:alpha/beta fold hydrolase [Egicoccus sp.]HSK23352.1 alpha/beta fold hydrolase [Egicoccus sp.]